MLLVCLSVCLMSLSPCVASFPVSSFPFFSLFQPGWFHLWFSPPPTPAALPPCFALRPCSSSGVHTSGFYHVCCCSCFPSFSSIGQLPPLSFFSFFHPCLQLSASGRSDSIPPFLCLCNNFTVYSLSKLFLFTLPNSACFSVSHWVIIFPKLNSEYWLPSGKQWRPFLQFLVDL